MLEHHAEIGREDQVLQLTVAGGRQQVHQSLRCEIAIHLEELGHRSLEVRLTFFVLYLLHPHVVGDRGGVGERKVHEKRGALQLRRSRRQIRQPVAVSLFCAEHVSHGDASCASLAVDSLEPWGSQALIATSLSIPASTW